MGSIDVCPQSLSQLCALNLKGRHGLHEASQPHLTAYTFFVFMFFFLRTQQPGSATLQFCGVIPAPLPDTLSYPYLQLYDAQCAHHCSCHFAVESCHLLSGFHSLLEQLTETISAALTTLELVDEYRSPARLLSHQHVTTQCYSWCLLSFLTHLMSE